MDPFQDNVVQPPPPPPGHRPNAIPPLMPPSVNSSHGTESSRGTEWNENSKFGASGRTPFSDENLGEEAINDFASDWGVDTGDSYNNESNDYDRDGHKEEYSSALTKLRGQRIMPGGPIDGHKPSSMLSALEKLRNFNKRGFNDTASPFGNKRFKFGNQDGPWFGSRDNSGYDEMSKNEQDDINSTLNLPFRKNNEETFFNQAIQNNRWNSNNLDQGVQNNFNRFDRTTPDNRSMGSRSFDKTTPDGQFMGPGGFDRTTPEGRSMGPGGFDRTTPEDRFMGPGGLDRTTPEGRFMGPGGFNRTNPEGRFMGPGGVDRTTNEGRFMGPEGHGRTTSEGRFMGPGGFDRTIPEGRFMGPGGFDRTTPEGRFMGPVTNFSENDNNMMNQLEPGEERDEPVNYKDVPDKDLLPILLKRNITTECERLYLENLVQQWIGIVSTDYDNLADQFKRNLADRRADRNRRLDSLVDLGTLYADFRLNMKVYDLTSGEEKSVFSSFKTDGIMMFKCEICSITVNSKKNLETHFMGKKHGNKLSEYSIVGMCNFLTSN